jgi:hypothetical protein
MDETIGRIRLLAVGAALIVGGFILVVPDSLSSQQEKPCEFGGEGDWTCAETRHLYAGECEGIDCYSAMEYCCLDPISN